MLSFDEIFDEVRNAIGESCVLSLRGRNKEALEVADRALTKAERCNSEPAIKALAMHASALSEFTGDREAAKLYLERVLSYEPGNPLALYGMASILRRQGRTAEANEIAPRLYPIARGTNTEEARGLEGSACACLAGHGPGRGVIPLRRAPTVCNSSPGADFCGSPLPRWTMQSGPGTVVFDNANQVNTAASFSTAGTHVLQLTASEGRILALNVVAMNADGTAAENIPVSVNVVGPNAQSRPLKPPVIKSSTPMMAMTILRAFWIQMDIRRNADRRPFPGVLAWVLRRPNLQR